MTSRPSRQDTTRPFLELRAGGVHLVIQRIPSWALTVLTNIASALGGVLYARGR